MRLRRSGRVPRPLDRFSGIRPWAGSSKAIGPKPVAVPLQDGGGLDEDEGSVPTRPDAAQPDPQGPSTVLEPEPPGLPLEHHQLMSKRDLLKREIPLTLQRSNGAIM